VPLSSFWLLVALAGVPRAAPPQDASAPIQVGPGVRAPDRVKTVEPSYPRDAQRAGLAGPVVLECTIGPQGDVREVVVRQGAAVLAEAATTAVKRWRYTPTLRDGVAVPVIMTVTIRFQLRELRFESLMAMLSHEDEDLREAAAGNLGGLKLRGREYVQAARDASVALERLAANDPSPRVRGAAARSLSRLDGRPLELTLPAEPGGAASAAPAPEHGSAQVGWGTFVDPLGQCSIESQADRLEIETPAGAFDLSSELRRLTAPRLMQVVDGDYEVHVTVDDLPEPVPGAKDARLPFLGAGLLVWQDERYYVRLESASYLQAGSVIRYALFEVRRDGRPVAGLALPTVRLEDGSATELRLTRRGRELRAQVRQGNGKWRDAGRAVLDLPPRLSVGIAALNVSGAPLRAGFTQFELTRLPAEF
jgi:TonB family protein